MTEFSIMYMMGAGIGALVAIYVILAVLIALALERYAEADPEMVRFDRLLKHWARFFAAAGILLVAGYCLFKFGKVLTFPLPNNMTMTVFAVLIFVVWSFMAAREKRLEVKTCYLALGAAFSAERSAPVQSSGRTSA